MTRLRLLLNTVYSGPQAWLLLAIRRGWLAEAGIALDLTQGTGAFNAAPGLVSGGYDLAYGDINALIGVAAATPDRAPIGIYATFNASPGAIAIRRDGPVASPGDLAGKRLIGHASDVALRTFGAFAAATGIDPAGVTVEPAEGPMAALAHRVLAGEADGLFGYVSTIAAALAAEGLRAEDHLRFLRYDQLVPDLYGSALMAAPHLLAEEALLRRLVAAIDRGMAAAIADPQAGIEAVLHVAPDADPAVERLRWDTTLAVEMARPPGIRIGTVDMARFARGVALQGEMEAGRLFTGRFLPAG